MNGYPPSSDQAKLAFDTQLIAVLESISDGFITLDTHRCFTYINRVAEIIFQQKREELFGKNVWEVFPEAVGTLFWTKCHEAADTRTIIEFEEFYLPFQKWFRVRVYPSNAGLAIYFQDITERRRSEEEVQRQAQTVPLQASLIELAHDAILVRDPANRIISWNRGAETLYGWTAQEAIGKVTHALLKTRFPRSREALDDLLAQGEQWEGELVHTRRDGGQVTVESRQVLVRDEVGQPVAILEINRDITGRKQREQENQEQYRTIVRTANEGIWLVDTQAQTVYINERMASMLGYTVMEMAGRSFPEFIFLEDQSSAHERIESNLQGNFEQFDFRFRRKDGSSLYTLASTNPVRDGRGGIVGALGMYTDLTERKQAEEALLTSEERLRLALEAGKIGVWDWDVQHDTLTWSERVYELYGVSKDSFTVTVENFINLVHPEDKAWVQEAIEKALTANAPFNIDLRIVTPQGVTRWLTTSASVTYDKARKPIRMLGATSDITEQKELEQRKDEFIGMASHELKTPITTLKARTQLLKRRLEKQGLSEAVQALAKMEMQIDRLTRLVADLLDISKIQAGRLDYAEERIALDAFLYDIVETAQQMSATHTLCIHGASDAYVIGDSDRLEQVFLNLISNAIKYSPLADKVDIRIETTRDTVTVKVRDYGVGIPTEHQSKIFDRFYRAYDEKNKTFPGLGMGLYISAEIIKRHGGEISVDSTEGEGTIFAVSLSVAQ